VALDTRISIYKLQILCAVVEHGGVSRAAEQLYISQPVVTAHIRSLEERLGAEIFQRAGRGVEPTEVGRIVYAWAKDLLCRSFEMAREIEGLSSGAGGSAVIAAGMTAGTYLLPRMLTAFYRDHRDAHITLTQQGPEGAVESLLAGKADFAIVMGAEHLFDPVTLRARHLLDEELVLVTRASGDEPEAVTVSELSTMRFVCSPADALRRRIVEQKLQDAGIAERNVVLAFDHAEAIKQAVLDGVGVALLFRSSVSREVAEGSMRIIDIVDAELSVPLYLASRTDKRYTPLQQRLYDYIFASCTARMPEVALSQP
jgi:LysR family transcriptional regulator, low CO2-responsive transcriptional regulator